MISIQKNNFFRIFLILCIFSCFVTPLFSLELKYDTYPFKFEIRGNQNQLKSDEKPIKIPSCDFSVQTSLEKGIAHFLVRRDKFGAIDKAGKWLLKCEFDYTIEEFSCNVNLDSDSYIEHNSKLLLSKNNKYGIWNTKGKNLISANYLTIENKECYLSDFFFLVNHSGIEIIDSSLKSIQKIESDLYLGNSLSALYFKKNEQIFCLDKTSFEVTMLESKENVCLEFRGKFGVLNSEGKMIYSFDSDQYIFENQIITKSTMDEDKSVETKYGLIDSLGTKLLEFEFLHIDKFDTKSVVFEVLTQKRKWGLIRGDGKPLSPFEYEDIDLEYSDLWVKNNYIVKLYLKENVEEFSVLLANEKFLLNGKKINKIELFLDLVIVYEASKISVFDYEGNKLVDEEIEDYNFYTEINNQENFQYLKNGVWYSISN